MPRQSRKGKPLLNAHAGGYLDNQAERRRLLFVCGRKTGQGRHKPTIPLIQPLYIMSIKLLYLGHAFTKLPVSLSLVPSTDVFRLCNFPKVLFLKLARIPVLFLILGRKFLTGEGHLSAPSRSFYSKVMADGTENSMSFYP